MHEREEIRTWRLECNISKIDLDSFDCFWYHIEYLSFSSLNGANLHHLNHTGPHQASECCLKVNFLWHSSLQTLDDHNLSYCLYHQGPLLALKSRKGSCPDSLIGAYHYWTELERRITCKSLQDSSLFDAIRESLMQPALHIIYASRTHCKRLFAERNLRWSLSHLLQ